MVAVRLTNGFGNNLFQYNAARLLADYLGQEIYCVPPAPDYYAIPSLQSLGLKFIDSSAVSGIMVSEPAYKCVLTKSIKMRHLYYLVTLKTTNIFTMTSIR